MSIQTLNPLLAAAALGWLSLASIWLFALEKTAKAKWMHRLHALLPLGVLAIAMFSPAESDVAQLSLRWLIAGAMMLAILTPVWVLSLVTRNAGTMDVFYSLTASLTAVGLVLVDGHYSARQLVFLLLVVVWSARLFAHASSTNLGQSQEQQPYATWRKNNGQRWWWWSYFQVFLLQGGLIWIWALTMVMAIGAEPRPLTPLDFLAMAIWMTGFVFQAGADWQLKRFMADPANKGKVLQSGLWSLTRHPNYFGQTTMWWGYFVFGLAHPLGWLAIVGPLYVTWFMSKGSAAAMLDRHMLRTKPDYAAYVERVAGFFPWFKSSSDTLLLERFRSRQRS
jgi:steroid 5-alpha reductase family enzyme